MAKSRISLEISDPDKVAFKGEADSVVLPAANGFMGVLPGHAPAIGLLSGGTVSVRSGQNNLRFEVEGGQFEITENSLKILARRASASEGK